MRSFSVLVVAMVAAACAAGEIPFVPGQGSDESLTQAERDVAKIAIDALAADLQIAKDGILVDTIRAVDWPDSSIGCPQPDRAYLQVVTPGHKISLRANGGIHVVHEAKGSAIVCRKSGAMGNVTSKMELAFGQQMLVAQKDLARRLGVQTTRIRPLSGVQKSWPDASLDCPEAGVTYTAGNVSGWVLTLTDGERAYTYHTDMKRTIACPAISND